MSCKTCGIKNKTSLSNKISLWSLNSFIQRGKTKVERRHGCFRGTATSQRQREQAGFSEVRPGPCTESRNKEALRLMLLTFLRDRFDQKVRTIPENWAKREKPRYLFVQSAPGLRFVVFKKPLVARKKIMECKEKISFVFVLTDSTGPTLTHQESRLFPTPHSAFRLGPLAAHTPVCLRSSWLVSASA